MILNHSEHAWSVPAPVRSGNFVSLFPGHEEFNVRVDLGAIGAYGCQSPRDSRTLLYADLQTDPAAHVAGRLGSGRAGFFRGRYIKGAGRTPLAANWNYDDYLHNSGHLPASAAIREYAATEYLRARGCGDTIVACEGVLLAELDPALRDVHGIIYPASDGRAVPAADLHFQAITVKQGNFARASNFIWFLHHLTPAMIDRQSSLAAFTTLLTQALTAPGEKIPDPQETDPATLALLFVNAVSRACNHFERWLSAGVWWGSFRNNFTLDGRFLDLETPAIAGGPFVGVLSSSLASQLSNDLIRSGLAGSELLDYLRQVAAACKTLVSGLRELPAEFSSVEREFAGELSCQLEEKLLSAESVVGNRMLAVDCAASIVERAFGGLSSPARDRLKEYLRREYPDGSDTSAADYWRGREFRRARDLPVISIEPGLRHDFFALALPGGRLLAPSAEQRRVAWEIADLIRDLDETASLSRLMDKLRNVPSTINALVKDSADVYSRATA